MNMTTHIVGFALALAVLGVCLWKAIAAGSERAKLALDVFVGSVLRYIGAYTAELGGLDAIAFTGGIGENSAHLRSLVLDRLAYMGIRYDAHKNEQMSGERRLSTEDSAVEVYVIPADEEAIVVDETFIFCQNCK